MTEIDIVNGGFGWGVFVTIAEAVIECVAGFVEGVKAGSGR